MDGEPRYRIVRVHEDADEDGELLVREPDDRVLLARRYEDRHPWRCGDCNQPAEPEWHRCPMCGRLREECEA